MQYQQLVSQFLIGKILGGWIAILRAVKAESQFLIGKILAADVSDYYLHDSSLNSL